MAMAVLLIKPAGSFRQGELMTRKNSGAATLAFYTHSWRWSLAVLPAPFFLYPQFW